MLLKLDVASQWFPVGRTSPLFGLLATIALLLLPNAAEGSEHSVYTFKNGSTPLGQLLTSSTLVWETYEPTDPKQLQYAVEGGKHITEEEHYPIYVCRAVIDGVPTCGHTEKTPQGHVCVVGQYRHGKYANFDVLVNRGHLGKIVWKPWRKFNPGVPIGAIGVGNDIYIARHRAGNILPQQQQQPEASTEGPMEWGADYNLGRLETVGFFGKIKVVEGEREKDYDEGEVLVEMEPFRYELRHIKLMQLRLNVRDNVTELASSILANTGLKYSMVETVMSYEYDYMQYWGSHEGVARGLPTKVYESEASPPAEITWGLKYTEKRYETKSANTQLHPGTAINVTLRGNYVTLEAPYRAKLFAFYYGSEESVSRTISSEVHKSYLKDVKLEFSPVYWIENGTVVPTTTTTTTTTSTTTHPTTTSTGEPKPMHEPPVVQLKNVGHAHSGPDTLEQAAHNVATANGDNASDEVPENYAEKHQTKSAQMANASARPVTGGGAAGARRWPIVVLLLPAALLAARRTVALEI